MTNFFIKILSTMIFVSPVATGINLDLAISSVPAKINMALPTEISAKSILVFDIENNSEVFAFNADEKRAMASLTKMMTALLILENHELDEEVVIPSGSQEIVGQKLWMYDGEKLSVDSLLRALFIYSANDSAFSLAIFDSKNVPLFVEKMNQRAKELGMNSTSFQNPHGLDNENHYSTARDLAFLASFLLKKDYVREVIQIKNATLHSTDNEFSHKIRNTNELLWDDDLDVRGMKTGTTERAGECLISLVYKNKREYLIVILGSENRFSDTKKIIEML